MPEYLSPAVYVEEISSGVKPLEGVGTSTAGFVGLATKGPIGVATQINNFSEFERKFGGIVDEKLLPFAVKAFFDEGGRTCYVVRTCAHDGDNAKALAASSTFQAVGASSTAALTVQAASPGTWGNDIAVRIQHPDAERFQLDVFQGARLIERFERLSMDKADKDYAIAQVNGVSQLVEVTDKIPPNSQLSPASRRPKPTEGTAPEVLQTSGSDGSGTTTVGDFTGKSGLQAFDAIGGVNIIAVPDASDRDIHVKGLAYCERRQDCFYIADSQAVITGADDVLNYKNAEGVFGDGNAISSKYGALYAPWIEVFDPRAGSGRIPIPPSGAIAGRYAAVDGTRGVHKAPAGVLDGKLNSALGLEFNFLAADQEKLNPRGINLIRSFPGTGPVIWGARTVSNDPEWRYVNVRRLFIFLRQSILEGTTWVVFEPNDRSLWKSIERNVSAFLHLQWLSGALAGETPDEAFYVKCDEETNPPESIKLGRVITEIGVAPSKPAEFVIFRIMQQKGGGSEAA